MIKTTLKYLEPFALVALVLFLVYINLRIGMFWGRALGTAEGYNQCHVDTVFPSRSELLKLKIMIEEVK